MSKSTFDRTDAMVFFGGITALSAVAVDIILPATGVVARDFGVDDAYGTLLVGVYLLAFAAGQLFWGLFSDAFGRRPALIISLVGFTLASVACALAPSFGFLIVMRALQGLTGGAPVIARAMVRDVSSGNDAAKTLAALTAILTIAILIAPVIGSGLLVIFDWRAIFWALAALGVLLLIYSVLFVEETALDRRPDRFSLSFVIPSAHTLMSMPAFLIPMIVGGLAFGGYAAMLSIGAVLTETQYGVTPEAFGSLFALAALSNTVGALGIRYLLKTIPVQRVFIMAVGLLGVCSLCATSLLMFSPSLAAFWGVVCLYVLGFGTVMPTSVALAMEPAGKMPGFAASLIGAIQMGIGAAGATLAAALFDDTHRAIPLTMALFGFAAVMLLIFGRKTMHRP